MRTREREKNRKREREGKRQGPAEEERQREDDGKKKDMHTDRHTEREKEKEKERKERKRTRKRQREKERERERKREKERERERQRNIQTLEERERVGCVHVWKIENERASMQKRTRVWERARARAWRKRTRERGRVKQSARRLKGDLFCVNVCEQDGARERCSPQGVCAFFKMTNILLVPEYKWITFFWCLFVLFYIFLDLVLTIQLDPTSRFHWSCLFLNTAARLLLLHYLSYLRYIKHFAAAVSFLNYTSVL